MTYSAMYKELLKQYDRLGDEARAVYNARLAEVYDKSPRFKQLDEQLAQTGVKISRAVLNGASMEIANEIKNTALKMNAEKREIIQKLGYPDNYLTAIYQCDKCKDTGHVQNPGMTAPAELCACFKQKLIDKLYDLSGLKNILNEENFNTFEFKYYSEEIDQRHGVSPVANIRKVYGISVGFVENFDKEYTNLLFYGDTGLGKTFLCNCIAKELMDTGRTVLYATAPRLLKRFEEQRFNRTEQQESDELLDMVFSVDLLIIDDLGSEFSSILTNSELFNIINTRILEKKSMIISTNLSINEFQNTYSDRIASRLFGNFKRLRFFGDDIRIKKKLSYGK